jgi:hypothetical protein
MSDAETLNAFGRFLMNRLRDPAIDQVDGLLKSHWKAPALSGIQKELAKLSANEKKLVRRVVVTCIDAALHDFLYAVQEKAEKDCDLEIHVNGENVAEISDGLHGEVYGDNGWAAQFSKHGSPPSTP